MPSKLYKTRVAFSVTNCICHDQRVQKMAEVVSRLGCEVSVIGRWSGECCDQDTVRFKTKRFSMIFKRGFLFYKFFNIRLLFHLLFNRYNLLVANDLDTLLPNYIISKIKRLPLVYDSHEYFTGVPEIQDRPFVKWVWKSIEKIIFPRLKFVMTVSDSIALQYEIEYGFKPLTIRNCSKTTKGTGSFSKVELGINENHLLLILQGTGINVDRGGEELIEAVGETDSVSLLIAGEGDLIGFMKNKVVEYNLSDRVKFFPKMPWAELMKYTKSADVGMSLDKDTNFNYRFSLPNKLFDYISAGIPLITGELPEISKIVRENNCGIIIPRVTPEEIAEAIRRLQEDHGLLTELKHNAAIASESINWENESLKVIEFYKSVLRNKGG